MRVGIIARYLFSPFGFGTMSRTIVREFQRQKVPFFLSHDSFDYPLRGLVSPRQEAFLRSLSSDEIPDIWLNIAPACRFGPRSRHRGVYTVGFSMFEALHNPQSWRERVQQVDEVWVPSRFNQRNFQELGLRPEQLVWMPLGVDAVRYRPARVSERPRNRAGKPFDFIVYSVGAYRPRKRIGMLMLAFAQVFAGRQDTLLIVKTAPWDYSHFAKDLCAVESSVPNPPPILGYVKQLPEQHMPGFFNLGDVFAYASGGEGQALPPLEAMSCGKPVISTDNTAMADYITDDVAYPVRSVYFDKHGYAFPVMSELRKRLWHVYRNREEAEAKGKKARDYIEQHRTLKICCARMVARLQEITKTQGYDKAHS